MALARGTRIGSHEILGPLGAGGMGEVYRARDTRLNRDVAIKVLPHQFTLDPERLARFTREAQLLASLNHPNIAAIYGLEETPIGSVLSQALVLELVEGPTLADRLAEGPIPIDESLAIARQIAEALEAAHEQGIVHRDLKPANIKVRPDGRVKILDFGLAKLTGRDSAPLTSSSSDSKVVHSPTFLATMNPAETAIGVVLGTAAYMSPEQAKGRAADKRSDVWAFGCVLFEMLTGSRPFEAPDSSGTVAAILERQPPWDRLPARTPALVRRLLHRCLEKDPKLRLRDIADARFDVEDALAAPAEDGPDRRASHSTALLAGAVAVAALAAAAIVWFLKPAAPLTGGGGVERARLLIAPAEPMPENEGVLVISRDGRRVAYAAGPAGRQRLYVREIDQFASTPIPESEGVVSATFSPDGQSIAFVAERKLRTVALAGGMPLTLRDRVDGPGLTWTGDRTILYNPGTAVGIWRIAVTGGEPEEVTKPGPKDNFQRFPEMLPGGTALLFGAQGGVNDDSVMVESLPRHERRFVVKGSAPHYLPTGHLAFVQGGTLFAVRFDPERLEAKGTPVTLLEGIRQTRLGQPLISYSDVGSIVYVATAAETGSSALVWVDQTGKEQPAGASGRPYAQPRLSPDGNRLVAAMRGNSEDLWLVDLARSTSNRLTSDTNTSFPVWTPDGRRLTLASAKGGSYSIYWRPVDGSAPDEPLMTGKWPYYPFSWAPDGKTLALVSVNPTTLQDVQVLSVDRKGATEPFAETPFREGAPVFSPDGKWIAYVSDDTGRFEIYVRPFPGPGEKIPISSEGGNEPVWPRNGRQLFYREGDSLMAVDIELTPVFSAGKPRKLFDRPYERSVALWPDYDASPDGQRLLMVRREMQAPPPTHINVVLNWLEDLKQKLPAQ
jgi:eukaryotic-like serine/threonine-protein kinase